MKILFRTQDTRLKVSWGHTNRPLGLAIEGSFISSFRAPQPPIPGIGAPDPNDPESLPKVFPIPSSIVLTSITGARVMVGGKDVTEFVVALDIMRPAHGETTGSVELVSRSIDPGTPGTPFKAGEVCEINLDLPGISIPVLRGYVVEPPKYSLQSGGLGALTLAVGDILLLKRQSETGRIEPYCGELPRNTAQAAQIFTNARGIPGSWGGAAKVEGINPDFVESAPWDFLAGLYEPLNWDVRTDINGIPGALPRGSWNSAAALTVTSDQCIEGNLDAPSSKPFSLVHGYSDFNADQGFKQQETSTTDYSKWNPNRTDAWFIGNNTYTVTKNLQIGDTVVQSRIEVWGYLPNNTVLPTGTRPGDTEGPCGEFIPAPELPVVSTTLGVIQVRIIRLYFEPHISGNYLVTRRLESVEGWNIFQRENGDTELYFGDLEGVTEEYLHAPIPDDRICPQYWPVVRTTSRTLTYSRVEVTPNTEPEYRLTSRNSESWERSQEVGSEGQRIQWLRTGVSDAYDSKLATWVGGTVPNSQADTPPGAQFIQTLKVPSTLESQLEFPEFVALFGVRESKPVQFGAYTQKDLNTATDRYAREAAGLAYGVHLVTDPRVPLKPGASVRYIRPNGVEIHGIVWSQEFNVSGTSCTQSVVLMRTFTEPGLLSLRDPGAPTAHPSDLSEPCF